MAVKLSESTWTGFTKDLIKKSKLDPKLKLDDAALIKALAGFDKTDESKPEPRLKALDELIKEVPEQVKALVKRKKELGDKPFGELKDKLYELLGEAENLHKAATAKAAEAKAAPPKGKGKDDEDEEEETPALLTNKMIPLLRELKKGEAVMPCLIALAGKETVVLVSRRAISPARGKLLKEQMAQPTGLKFIRGECLYEKSALTFVVQSPGAALAKRLRQALLDQTQMRWKVRVRGEDGVEEEDGVEDEQPRKPATPEQLAYTQRLLKVRDRYQKALREQHPNAVKFKELMDQANAKANEQQDHAGAIQALQALEKAMDEPERTPGDGVDPGEAFKARLTELLPRLKEAQAAGGDKAQDVKLKVSEAGTFARKKNFDQADRMLDEVEIILAAPVAGMNASSVPKTSAAKGTNVIFQQSRLAWDATRSTLKAEVKKLEDDILARCKDDEDVGSDGVDLGPLSTVLEMLDSRLMDKLDEALSAQDPDNRQRFHLQAKDIVTEYMAFINDSPLMVDIDDSGFAPVAVRKTALSALTLLASKL